MSAPTKDPITVTRWILREQQRQKSAKGDLSILLNSITLACKMISNAAKAAGIYQLYGLSGNENASGDSVKKLDVFSNDCMINCVKWTGSVALMCSEENEDPIKVDNVDENKYVVLFDPLDGSSNIDANVSVGTIFGIYRVKDSKNVNKNDLLQKGKNLVCAGYAMYGDATILVISFGDTVQGFTLDPTIGEFLLTHKDITIKNQGKIYSINEGNSEYWDPVIAKYVAECKDTKQGSKKPKKARYIGSMVADVHRTLLYGGIFLYPGTKPAPNGKLRLTYEGNPMAFIVEAAGGKATNGYERILDIQPSSLHCKTPIILGSTKDVDRVIEMYKESKEIDNNDRKRRRINE